MTSIRLACARALERGDVGQALEGRASGWSSGSSTLAGGGVTLIARCRSGWCAAGRAAAARAAAARAARRAGRLHRHAGARRGAAEPAIWEARGAAGRRAEDGDWLGMAGIVRRRRTCPRSDVWGMWVDPRHARRRASGAGWWRRCVDAARAAGLRAARAGRDRARAGRRGALRGRRVPPHGRTRPSSGRRRRTPSRAAWRSRSRRRSRSRPSGCGLRALQPRRLRSAARDPVARGRRARWLPGGRATSEEAASRCGKKIAATGIGLDGDALTLAIERQGRRRAAPAT